MVSYGLSLRARAGAAPLKHDPEFLRRQFGLALRARAGAAPLKLWRRALSVQRELGSPRPRGRGPVEARKAVRMLWTKFSTLRARAGAAPLKQQQWTAQQPK